MLYMFPLHTKVEILAGLSVEWKKERKEREQERSSVITLIENISPWLHSRVYSCLLCCISAIYTDLSRQPTDAWKLKWMFGLYVPSRHLCWGILVSVISNCFVLAACTSRQFKTLLWLSRMPRDYDRNGHKSTLASWKLTISIYMHWFPSGYRHTVM